MRLIEDSQNIKRTEKNNKIVLYCSFTIQIFLMIFSIVVMSVAAQVLADSQNLKGILDHKASLQISTFPIGFWNHADLGRHGKYFDEEDTIQS
jgi:hypothetical protein